MLCVPHLAAQSSATGDAPRSVSIPFVVTSRDGKPIGEITAADIVVRDDKKAPREISDIVSGVNVPLRLGLLIQDSTSMGEYSDFGSVIAAAGEFARRIAVTDADRVLVETFSDRPDVSEWMDRNQLAHFSTHLRRAGRTALYDAVATAAVRMSDDSSWPARRVIVIITNAHDTASHTNAREAVAAVLDCKAVAFVIQLRSAEGVGPHEEILAEELTSDLGKRSGGFHEEHVEGEGAARIFDPVREWISGMHVVTYTPSEASKNGHHSIEIKPATNKEWRVHAPQGYDEK